MIRIKDIGEQGLIARFMKRLRLDGDGSQNRPHVIVPQGDDAYACSWRNNKALVATADMLIEGVHFSAHWNRWEDIGYKALAVNISDLSAMGDVTPLYALVSIGLKPGLPVPIVDKLLTGMLIIANRWGIKLVGGDTVKSPKSIVLSISLIGEADPKNLVRRSGAQVGDKLLVSGPLGLSGAGLQILSTIKGNMRKSSGYKKKLITSHVRPPIRLSFGKWVGKNHMVSSMIDSSDGLHCSLEQLCGASGVGCRVFLEKLPVSSYVKKWCSEKRIDPYSLLLFGGEDYELICTASQKKAHKIVTQFKNTRSIGEVVHKNQGIQYWLNRRKVSLTAQPFRHFT